MLRHKSVAVPIFPSLPTVRRRASVPDAHPHFIGGKLLNNGNREASAHGWRVKYLDVAALVSQSAPYMLK